MFCTNCGAQLPDDSRFCERCGAALAPAADVPAYGVRMFARTGTMAEAAQTAIARNPDGKWSHWDEPARFTYNAAKLLRYCEKEDLRLQGEAVSYAVSPDGAIARLYTEDGESMLEWGFFTRGCPPEALPATPAALY